MNPVCAAVISAQQALDRLQNGNRRFVSDAQGRKRPVYQSRRSEWLSLKQPFAIVLGCSDSRVPTEIVFDQGLGDLFVVRVAGNIATPSQIGSVEFAAERFGVRLVVVLGHSECNAVRLALQEAEVQTESRSPHLDTIVEIIRPSMLPLLEEGPGHRPDGMMRQAVRANIRASVSNLQFGSTILGQLIKNGELLVVGAEYSLRTGVVHFIDGLPKVG